MGKIKNFLIGSLAGILTAVAFLGIRPTSLGLFYQPTAPEELMKK